MHCSGCVAVVTSSGSSSAELCHLRGRGLRHCVDVLISQADSSFLQEDQVSSEFRGDDVILMVFSSHRKTQSTYRSRMAGSVIAVFSDLLKKLEDDSQTLHVIRTLVMANIPEDVAKELKMVDLLTPFLAQKDLKGPVIVVLAKLGVKMDEKKKESRKRKASETTKDSKAPAKKRKAEEPKENVAPKKAAPPKKPQQTALLKKCLKQARGMQIWKK